MRRQRVPEQLLPGSNSKVPRTIFVSITTRTVAALSIYGNVITVLRNSDLNAATTGTGTITSGIKLKGSSDYLCLDNYKTRGGIVDLWQCNNGPAQFRSECGDNGYRNNYFRDQTQRFLGLSLSR